MRDEQAFLEFGPGLRHFLHAWAHVAPKLNGRTCAESLESRDFLANEARRRAECVERQSTLALQELERVDFDLFWGENRGQFER